MTKIYTYEVEEQTIDVRPWTIESDKQLTEEEVAEIYQDFPIIDEGQKQEYSTGIMITFEGIQYGEDSEFSVQGDFKYLEKTGEK